MSKLMCNTAGRSHLFRICRLLLTHHCLLCAVLQCSPAVDFDEQRFLTMLSKAEECKAHQRAALQENGNWSLLLC
jgi:hypothetical protein